MDQHKLMEAFKHFILFLDKKKSHFLDRIISCDDKWIYFKNKKKNEENYG